MNGASEPRTLSGPGSAPAASVPPPPEPGLYPRSDLPPSAPASERYPVRMNIAISRAFGALRIVAPRSDCERDEILQKVRPRS